MWEIRVEISVGINADLMRALRPQLSNTNHTMSGWAEVVLIPYFVHRELGRRVRGLATRQLADVRGAVGGTALSDGVDTRFEGEAGGAEERA